MPKKGTSVRKRFCGAILAGMTLLGVYACNSSPPTTPQPSQAPVVIQPDNGKGSTSPTPKPSTVTTVMLGQIKGRKFLDQDGNRQFSASDKPVSNWDIRIYPSSVMQTNAWSNPMAATTTDSNGYFSFTGLQNGTYVVASAVTGKNGERYQQITPLTTTQAQCVTLPQQAYSYCEPTAYQVTVDATAQPCDLSFLDYGAGLDCGLGYGGLGYPYGAYAPIVVPVVAEEDEVCYEDPIPLRTAANFAILAGTAVMNAGSTIVTGNIGVSPGNGNPYPSPTPTVYGSVFLADATASQAKNDLTNAILTGFGRASTDCIRNGNLSGKTLLPGVYNAEGGTFTLAANSTLTLDANDCGSDAVWIFQAQNNLQVGSYSRVVLANGAKPSNVFWVVGNSATIGTGSIFVGNILAQQSITLDYGVNLQGRALALVGSVTLDTDIVNRPTCN